MFQITLNKLGMDEFEMYAFPQSMTEYGAGGALVKMQGFPSGGNSVLVYFSCVDCGVEAKRLAASGGRIEREKFSIGQYGFIALCYDTEGNMIGLHSISVPPIIPRARRAAADRR